ncbi:pyridoxal phosphate-dependent transferase [Exophiala viscosa]|uniref:pyridoxal phosphate-dependent transferase n=1 Tax=Exophiala viscosa TaxID=2486360 RepID=UPI00218D2FE1|nr:pyridoxal phosphate-dependent transferase [Exophiala viscosa]
MPSVNGLSTDKPSAMFNRSLTKKYPLATEANGIYVSLEDGRKIIDGCCGAAVSCLGYQHPRVIQTMIAQCQKFSWVHTSFYTHRSQEDLSNFLISKSHGVFSKVAHYSSGSEAVETALKMARQYHISNNQPERIYFVARIDAYHGNTLGALAAGYNLARRAAFQPMCSTAFRHVDRCFYRKDARPNESEQAYVDRLLRDYEAEFRRLGAGKVAAVILEPVTGATIGTVTPVSNYLTRIRQLCDSYGVLLIYDEVMCGMGRTGIYHAWEGYGGLSCAPDLQAIGKGLAAGYQPLSSVLISDKVYKVLEGNDKTTFVNGHTYQGHAMACATALTVQQVIFDDDLLSNVKRQGEYLVELLNTQLPPEIVYDIRGQGLFRTVEFTDISGRIGPKVRDICFDNGLAVYLASGDVDAILFAPPFIITDNQTEDIVRIFVRAVSAARKTSTSTTSQKN